MFTVSLINLKHDNDMGTDIHISNHGEYRIVKFSYYKNGKWIDDEILCYSKTDDEAVIDFYKQCVLKILYYGSLHITEIITKAY
jgi:hypothetical protein